jgi:peptide deformylase
MPEQWPVRLRVEQAGAEILHQPSRPVAPAELASPDVQRLIDLMFATLEGVGVGLAAPQVGVGLQIVVIEDPARFDAQVSPELLRQQERIPVPRHVLVNPIVDVLDPTRAEFFEGCLSVDGYRAVVPRARRLRVRALDRAGQVVDRDASGWYARIIQHETDHLAGRLYLERMLPRTYVSAASVPFWTSMPIEEAKRRLSVVGA